MTRKQLMRQALIERCQAEREARQSVVPLYGYRRLEEALTLQILKDIPSIFFFAEQISKKRGGSYMRPGWAGQAYGAR